MKKIIKILNMHEAVVVMLFFLLASLVAFFFFVPNGSNLLYGDALSRLNISRKILDNLTPGLAQLGNVWLPLPQILMLLFVWNDYLWHSGIAGSIVSMAAYIVGSVAIYKTIRVISNSFITAFFSTLIYSLNINLLYLQTTAMSESLFLAAVSLMIYFIVKWIKTDEPFNLIWAGVMVSCASLIRYEALAILGASIPMVFIYKWIESGRFRKAESNVILFATIACLGFALWTLYLAAIFGDALYWKNYYAGTQTVGDGNSQLQQYVQQITFSQAIWKYATSVLWMNGVIPVFFALLGMPIVLYRSLRERSYYFLPILMSLSIFLFMVLTLMRNTPIDQPVFNIDAIFSNKTNLFPEFNIRYGLLMLPMITLLASYLFNTRNIVLKLVMIGLLGLQFYTYVVPKYNLMYQIPLSVATNITQGTPKEKAMVVWMKKNYDGGLIMISALKHDPQMLQMGYRYRTYIHEGTGRYWKESKNDPQRYAKWVVFDSYNKSDQVTKYLKDKAPLRLYYNQVYNNDGMYVYKIKTKVDKEL